jgi:small-conductance mechanosensitive channel
MKPLRCLALLFVSMACFAMISSNGASGSNSIILQMVGPDHQEVNAGDSVVYQWFIYNGYNSSFLLQATADVTSGPGWTSEFNTPIAVLNPGMSLFVNLTVKASEDVDATTANQTVFFNFKDLNNSAFTRLDTSTAKTDMIPTWGAIAPGKNKLLGQFENPLPSPFDDNYGTFALNVGIWTAIALFLAFVVGPMMRLVTQRTKTDLDDRFLKVIHKPIFALVIVFGLVSSLAILPLTEREVAMMYEAYWIVLIAVLTFVVYKLFKEIVIHLGRRWAERTQTELDVVLIPILDKIGGLVILIFGAMATLSYLHYNITFLLAGVGVFGLVLAFAAQDALSNFFSGVALLLDRPFVEGDFITISSGELCRVEKIGIRSCRLYDVFQNNHIVLPNNKLVNDKIVNMNEPDERGVVEVALNVVHGSDIGKVEQVLTEVATDNPEVLEEEGREPAVRLSNFGESALEFKLFVWVPNFMMKYRVAHELRKEINKRFAEEGIEIAVPQRKVYLQESKE